MELESVCALAENPGLIGRKLSSLPLWLRREADRWEDPWAFLLGVRDMPRGFKRLFCAAQSQRHALARLAEAAAGAGSISRSFHLELRRAPDQKTKTHWANKVIAPILQTEDGRRWLLEDKKWPAGFHEEAQRRYGRFYAADLRRLGKKGADRKWRGVGQDLDFKQETASDKIAVQMTMGWLSLPGGFPGYCFLSDDMIAKVLGLFVPFLKSADWKLVRTIRERIGLKKGEIIVTRLKQLANGDWAALDSRDRGVGLMRLESGAVPPKL